MMKIRTLAALGAALAVAILGGLGFAQDDLDSLLKDLEAETKSAAKPAVEPKAAEAAEVKVAEEVKVEGQGQEPAAEAAEVKAEEVKVEGQGQEAKAEEVKAEEPKVEAPVAEVKTEVKAEEPKAEEVKVAEEVKAEEPKAEVKVEEPKAEAPVAKVEAPVAAPKVAAAVDPEAELLSNIATTETLRRQSLDSQAKRELELARGCMEDGEYTDAVRHYGVAQRMLNDRADSKPLRKECERGIAEGLYQAAMAEEEIGRRDRAIALMQKAVEMRHAKAKRVLDKWSVEGPKVDKQQDISELKHRQNDKDYKADREAIRKHLKRSRQYLALRDMNKALEEVEIVLIKDPYNQEAIRLRGAIEKKRQTILKQERQSSRDGMIADVDQAWRPVYAVNAAKMDETTAETVKQQTGDDPERTMEQDIEKRMKEMRLPTISFKPPATIIDAVEFFRTASKDYDRPDIPIEKRGFNFVLRTPQGAIKTQAAAAEGEESNDFSSNGDDEAAGGTSNGLDPIPMITASDITLHEALKLVCDSVDYKFIVRGPVVMVMQKDMSTAEILSRKYNVPEAFMERVSTASEEMKSMGGFGSSNAAAKKGGDEEGEAPDRDWKAFFEEMGVKWPEGSSIKHVKALGKLYVRNTRENLAEFEKVLDELGGQPQLIEIEARFVEVSQEDLNSLGFEWILNSDYSLNLNQGLAKALGVSSGEFGNETGSRNYSTSSSATSAGKSKDFSMNNNDNRPQPETYSDSFVGNKNSTSYDDSYTRSTSRSGSGQKWIKGHTNADGSANYGGDRTLGVNAFGGTSDYSSGNRYLSTTGNHISGSGNSQNDQFMRVNAFLGSADLSMILHMLSQRSDTDLLSAPKVVSKSGETATIKVVTEYIYPQDYDVTLSQQSGSSGSSSSSSGSSSMSIAVVEPQNFTMREVGVILEVTPTYSEANGGTIDLEMKPQVVEEPIWHNYGMKVPITGNVSQSPSLGWVTDLGTEVKDSLTDAVSSLILANQDEIATSYVNAGLKTMQQTNIEYYDVPMEQPWFKVRSVDSKVSITPGATVVMGGLITEERKAMDDKIPFLGDLPYIGRLFRSHAEQTSKRNLLIFVTGRLITPSGREINMGEVKEDTAEVKPAPEAK